ncbi:MAG TPA: exo-beta-N-acetylmuramidase NamZ domain-containing protein [Bryobacteraceae bacterium]|nr:exo-beta-N-acetylmuramidase NamZ domain-containing protein [Bryobacteraceae bacterium]
MKSIVCGLLLAAGAFAQGFSAAQASALDHVVEQAVREHEIPGAVLVIGHKGEIIFRKAYGHRALVPEPEPMTVDTIFDCASLTKVVATTSGLMKLFELGKLRLNDRVTQYLPEFQGGRSDITIRNLMTHFSGLPPDLELQPPWSGYENGIHRALIDKPIEPPGVRFIYSDINYILLGEIVRRLSGEPLPDFVHHIVFEPLGMHDTMFQPLASLRSRIAPTEIPDHTGVPLRGVVHDPTARYMGGVAGHAGLFSTAGDLARFCQMLLNKGEWEGARIFSPLTVEKFTTPQTPPDQPILRGLGWDIDSPYSGERGELFPIGSYGHTGFTGTSLWLDPVSDTYVILMTNAVHPHLGPSITPLRGKAATVAAAALGIAAPVVSLTGYNETFYGAGLHRKVTRNGEVQTGLDVWKQDRFRALAGKRVGLITNQTGVDRQGNRNVDDMVAAGVRLAAIFSPEHGIAGTEDHENIGNTKDQKTGIPVFSLYGKNLRPTPEMLRGIDALVFDIQDIGARFYTYETTMAYSMEAAAKEHIPFYVLDRPNPITGVHVEAPILDRDKLSFVGYFPLPLRHGMTMGELATLFNAENHIGADLTVVRMKGWERGDWFDSTGLPWVNPSPNIRSLTGALVYPGVAMLEYSQNYSVGRGTEAPFEIFGAEFIHGVELAAYLNQRWIPGTRFYAMRFQPAESHLAGKEIEGLRIVVTDRDSFDAARLGLEIAAALLELYPGKIALEDNQKLIGNEETMRALASGEDPQSIRQKQQDALEKFLAYREQYLLYR